MLVLRVVDVELVEGRVVSVVVRTNTNVKVRVVNYKQTNPIVKGFLTSISAAVREHRDAENPVYTALRQIPVPQYLPDHRVNPRNKRKED